MYFVMTESDESAPHAFEFRRQLGVILAKATLLEDESLGPVTPEQRDALEEVVAATLKLTAETADTLETHGDTPQTTDDRSQSTDDDLALDQPADDILTPGESPATPESATVLDSIVLGVGDDEEFVTSLERQFERAGYAVHTATDGDDLRTMLDRSRPQHLVLDCRFPAGTFHDGLERTISGLDGETSLTLVSTVEGDLPGPLQGIAGILASSIEPEPLAALLENRFELPIESSNAGTAVAVVGDVGDRFLATLDELDNSIDRVTHSSATALDAVDPGDVDFVFLSGPAIDHADESALAGLRNPTDGEAIPLVAVGSTPTEAEWVPFRGHRTLAQTPLTSTQLAAAVLAAIEPDPDEER